MKCEECIDYSPKAPLEALLGAVLYIVFRKVCSWHGMAAGRRRLGTNHSFNSNSNSVGLGAPRSV